MSHVAAAATSEAHGCKDLLAVSATGEAVRRAAGVLDTTSKDDSDQRTLFVEGFPLHVQGLVPVWKYSYLYISDRHTHYSC